MAYFINRAIKYDPRVYPDEKIGLDGTYRPTFDKIKNLAYSVWTNRTGVCRHNALLAGLMLKYAGVDIRYVGGYATVVVSHGKRVRFDFVNPANYLDLPYDPGRRIQIYKFENVAVFVDATGVGHAWIAYYDPAAGWIPLDPTRMRDPLFVTVPYNIPSEVLDIYKYTPIGNEAIPVYDIHILNTYRANITAVRIRGTNYLVVGATGVGISVMKDNETIKYFPGNFSVIIPADAHFVYDHAVRVREGDIKAYLYNKVVLIKVDGVNEPLYIKGRKGVIQPIFSTHEGYHLYKVDDLLIENNTITIRSGLGEISIKLENATNDVLTDAGLPVPSITPANNMFMGTATHSVHVPRHTCILPV